MSDPVQSGGRRTNPVRGYDGASIDPCFPSEIRKPHKTKNTSLFCGGKDGRVHEFQWMPTVAVIGKQPIAATCEELRYILAWRWEQQICLRCGRQGKYRTVSHPARAERYLMARGWSKRASFGDRYWADPKGRIFTRSMAVCIQRGLDKRLLYGSTKGITLAAEEIAMPYRDNAKIGH